MLRFEHLSKQYGAHRVFDNLGYTAAPGCIALRDENCTGKSTLLQVLAGALAPDQGEIWIDGHALRGDPLAAKAALAYVPDDCMAYPFQTGREFLAMVAAAKHVPLDDAVFALAQRFQLDAHLDKRFEQMSLGTRKKIYLTSLALGAPRVILADEPSEGLDAPARTVLAEWFKTLGERAAVLFVSHDAALIRGCAARSVSLADFAAT